MFNLINSPVTGGVMSLGEKVVRREPALRPFDPALCWLGSSLITVGINFVANRSDWRSTKCLRKYFIFRFIFRKVKREKNWLGQPVLRVARLRVEPASQVFFSRHTRLFWVSDEQLSLAPFWVERESLLEISNNILDHKWRINWSVIGNRLLITVSKIRNTNYGQMNAGVSS